MADDTAQAPLTGLLEDLRRSGRRDAVSVGDIVDAFQHRCTGALIALLGLLAALPVIGAVPGMSVITGSLVILALGQLAVGRGTLWVPGVIRRRTVGRDALEEGVEKARPWTRRVDALVKPRLTGLVAGRLQLWLAGSAAALLALTFYPLALVPFGVTAPALGITAIGLGLLAYDGVLVLIGYGFFAVTAYLVATLV